MVGPYRPVETLAARLQHASRGPNWRPVILGLIACIGERVRPASPALDSPARDRWELAQIARLQRQIESIRERRRGAGH